MENNFQKSQANKILSCYSNNDEISKGGPGSGRKPYMHEISKQKYDWGTFRNIKHGSSYQIPIHPEHWNKIVNTHQTGEKSHFKDETGEFWNVTKHPENGVVISSKDGRDKTHLTNEHIENLK